MELLRAFIAIEFPDSLLANIEKQTARLRGPLGDELVRWVPTQNLHLTLKFIGNVAKSQVDFLKQLVSQITEKHSRFDLQIAGSGSFPNAKRPRILWARIQAPAELASLQKSIEDGASRLGYEKESRAFSPHLTLGRIRQNVSAAELQKIRNILESTQIGYIGNAHIDSVYLFQSELHPRGSIYTKLFSAKLKET